MVDSKDPTKQSDKPLPEPAPGAGLPDAGVESGSADDGGVGRGAEAADKPVPRAPTVCICSSCGRTEAKLPASPCHEMECPRCLIPMREV